MRVFLFAVGLSAVCSVEGFLGPSAFAGPAGASLWANQGLGKGARSCRVHDVGGRMGTSSPFGRQASSGPVIGASGRSSLLPLGNSQRPGAKLTMPMTASVTATEDVEGPVGVRGFSLVETKALIGKIALLCEPFWSGESSAGAWIWSVATISLALFSTLYAVVQSFVQRFFWNALNAKDIVKFNKFLVLYVGILCLGPPILVLFDWAKNRMALRWREALTQRYLGTYLSKAKYYKLPLVSDVDNADQRIAEDIKSFTDKAVNLFCTTAVAVCDLIVFSVILYKIYPPLYALLLAYSFAGTAATIFFGRPLIELNGRQLKREADLRYSLVRVRENSESIAFYDGDNREKDEAMSRFGAIYTNARTLMNFERNLGFFTKTYRYIVQVLPALVIGPRYFAGKVELGVISQTFFSFNHVLNDLSIVVNEFSGPNGISSFSAGVDRLHELEQSMAAVEARNLVNVDNRIRQTTLSGSDSVQAMQLHVKTPLGPAPRMLARDLNFNVAPGERLLIVGRSGIGKSSILRALAGLWDEGGGQVVRPPMGESLFLSQKPYMTIGSLRDNCVYPSNGKGISNDDVMRALEAVNMGNAAERVGGLHNKVDFSQIFSLGEQQRLQFARILLNRPRVVILDESTSALDLENEVRVYDLLLQLGVTVISVGNRPSLVAFHDRILRMMGDGEWQMEEPQWKIDQAR